MNKNVAEVATPVDGGVTLADLDESIDRAFSVNGRSFLTEGHPVADEATAELAEIDRQIEAIFGPLGGSAA